MNIDIKTEVKQAIKELDAESGGGIEQLKNVIREVMQEPVKVTETGGLKAMVREAVREEIEDAAKRQAEGLIRLLNVA